MKLDKVFILRPKSDWLSHRNNALIPIKNKVMSCQIGNGRPQKEARGYFMRPKVSESFSWWSLYHGVSTIRGDSWIYYTYYLWIQRSLVRICPGTLKLPNNKLLKRRKKPSICNMQCWFIELLKLVMWDDINHCKYW